MPRKPISAARFVAIAIAILAAISTSDSRAETPPDSAVGEKAAPAAEIREGKRFTVHVVGQGPDVILIPGLASPRAVWDQSVKALAGCHRLHLVELRGFGGDDPGVNANGPVLEPFVRELADYMDDEIMHKGGKPAAIIGHSMGGLAGMMIAARQPQLVGRLMIVDALPFIGTLFDPNATAASIRPQAEAIAAAMRAEPKRNEVHNMESDSGVNSQAGFWSNSRAGRIAVARWSRVADKNVAAQAMLDDMTTDMRPELQKISAPVTLLYAQDDSVMSAERTKAVFEAPYASVKDFTAQMISDSRHFIMLDQPEKFESALREFLGG